MKVVHAKTLLKPIIFWLFVLIILIEFVLHYNLRDLPYKFLNHTTGPIQRLGQYSKNEVLPNNYIALIGDSNVYGYGPWLYDNSWSMEQPSFATHHLLYSCLKRDVIAFGYPGYGSLGSALSMVGELRSLKQSWLWSEIDDPTEILFVFYEGNDLINNLHEVEQRNLRSNLVVNETLESKLNNIFRTEERKIKNNLSGTAHIASWNLFSGLAQNYWHKFFPEETKHFDSKSPDKKASESQKEKKVPPINVALINGRETPLGFCEGPALLLHQDEILLSLKITEHSLSYLKSNFPASNISLVYLPSSLAVYEFSNCKLSPAPLSIYGEDRSGLFKPNEAKEKNRALREKLLSITQSIGVDFWDTTDHLAQIAHSKLLHGPRDPIHLNRAGYESFTDAILSFMKPNS